MSSNGNDFAPGLAGGELHVRRRERVEERVEVE